MEEHACYQEIFTDRKKILFLANVIAFSNLENTYDYIRKYIRLHNRDSTKINLKIYFLLQFLSNRPETFRICSRDHLETCARVVFLIKASKPKLFDFENIGSGKITKKTGSRFSKSNNLG